MAQLFLTLSFGAILLFSAWIYNKINYINTLKYNILFYMYVFTLFLAYIVIMTLNAT